MPQTPNHEYNVPNEGAQDWHIPLNENFRQYDTDIEIRDIAGSKGNYEPTDGAKFLATDTGVVSIGDGSDWIPVFVYPEYDESDDGSVALSVDGTRVLSISGESGDNAGNLVAGHSSNSVGSGVVGATVAGGGKSRGGNSVSADYGTIGGGRINEATGRRSVVGGGQNNVAGGTDSTVAGGRVNDAAAQDATVGGGWGNSATAKGSSVGGGWLNEVQAAFGTVAGGGPEDESNGGSTKNVVYDDYGTIGGGGNNQAGVDSDSTTATFATVGGGKRNVASGLESTVGGGFTNEASALNSTVGGGSDNEASEVRSTVGGGWANEASGGRSTVGGGKGNVASGDAATVPGGENNEAQGSYSFAAGREATAAAYGAFVWGDGSEESVVSDQAHEFVVQAGGGATLYSSSTLDAGVSLAPGDGTWSSVSTRTAKTNISPTEPEAVLEQVETLDVSTWEYDSAQDATHMGPMAEEFYDAFGLGADEECIATVDADGVALAAIQGLSKRLDRKDSRIDAQAERIDELAAENERLAAENDELRERLAALEQRVADIEEEA